MANVSAFLKPTKGKPTTKVRFYVSRGRSETRLFYTSDIEVNAECFDSKKQIINVDKTPKLLKECFTQNSVGKHIV